MNKEKTLENLKKRGYEALYFETGKEAIAYMAEQVKGKTIGIGGSMTVKELGLEQTLGENNTIYWHWNPTQVEKNGEKAVRNLAETTDVYISSVNALAETGEIINIDGTGNRIASIAYGHDTLYLIAGKNKVAENMEAAMWRARNVAAPKNAQRLNKKTPCAVRADKCYDCDSPERICRGFLTLERAMKGMKTVVILIGEDFGM